MEHLNRSVCGTVLWVHEFLLSLSVAMLIMFVVIVVIAVIVMARHYFIAVVVAVVAVVAVIVMHHRTHRYGLVRALEQDIAQV